MVNYIPERTQFGGVRETPGNQGKAISCLGGIGKKGSQIAWDFLILTQQWWLGQELQF